MAKTKFLTRKYTGTKAETTLFFLDGAETCEEEFKYNSSFEELNEEEIIKRVKEAVKNELHLDALVKVNTITNVQNMVKLPVDDLLTLTELREKNPSAYEDIFNQLDFSSEDL